MRYATTMKIGQLADATGVSTKTIRYYETIGVMPSPERAANGYRSYPSEAADRLSFIREAQASGLSLVEIQLILELRDQGESTCGHTIGMLESHLEDVEKQLSDLRRTKERLTRMISRASQLDPRECSDPNRCQTISSN